jgi:hypothetical protein
VNIAKRLPVGAIGGDMMKEALLFGRFCGRRRRGTGIRGVATPALALVTALFAASSATAQTVTFTEAQVNSQSSLLDPAPDLVRSLTGADVQAGPVAGTRNLAFGSNPNFVIKPVTDSVFAKASLLLGTVKTKAVLQFGNNSSVLGSGILPGSRNGSASANATFADSFRTYSGPTPFLWTTGTTVTFNFGVTGQFALTGTIPRPTSSAPGQPLDQVYALLYINIFKPGTIDLLRQQKEFDFSAYPDFQTADAAFTALANQIQANLITRDYWYFGDVVAWYGSTVPAAKILPINTVTPTPVQFQFTPGGDFDWTVTMETAAQLDASLQSVSATLDFSNSVDTSYAGPDGTATYSGSGLFPGTQPFSAIPPPPPTGACPVEQGVWKSNPVWPVASLTLGTQTYTKSELLAILQNPGNADASAILAVQLIATKLNLANGSDPAPIAATVAAADGALTPFAGKLFYKVKPSSAAGSVMTTTGTALQTYNRRLLTPGCTP